MAVETGEAWLGLQSCKLQPGRQGPRRRSRTKPFPAVDSQGDVRDHEDISCR